MSAPLPSVAASTAGSAKVTPQTTALSPPVTISYGGSSYAFTISDTGDNRGISTTLTNAKNAGSALFGETYGTGAGLTGFNAGIGGPGGKFEVVNADSPQAGAFATTNGTGNAVLGTITNADNGNAAIYGVNDNGSGVEGDGSTGVYGYSALANGVGVDGYASAEGGYGLYGYATAAYGVGVYGESSTYLGVYGLLDSATPKSGAAAVYAEDNSAGGAHSYGLYATSPNNVAVYGTSTNISAQFVGGRSGSGTCYYAGGAGWDCSSDRNLKKDFVPVDTTTLLKHLAAMPVFEYSLKGDAEAERFVGPTAQDFLAAFHLGNDDKRINTANAQGVAIAAAKGLYEKLKQDEAEIANLKQQLAEQASAMPEAHRKDAEIAALATRLNAQATVNADLRVLTDSLSRRMAMLEQHGESANRNLAALRDAASTTGTAN